MISLEMTEKEAQRLEKCTNVDFVEEDLCVEGSWKKHHKKKIRKLKKNKSQYEWNVRMIGADKIKKETTAEEKTKKVKIAILDSGVDYGNDIDLAYSISLVPGEEEMTPLFMDGSGHGNSVAGLIAAEDNGEGITGINPNAEIYSIRVLDDDDKAPVSRVVEGIYMAMEQDVNIINMSFGLSSYSEALKKAITDATEAGILVIAAAGNTGENGVQYPAAYSEVMAVGAVDQMGDVTDDSARGKEIEIVAPGELVRSTGLFDSNLVASGTSLAAPQVAAVASLIWEKDLSVSADFVRSLLNESANAYGESKEYGNGLLDANYALSHYEEYKESYEEEKDTGTLADNKTAVIGFEDTGCVEGCWSVSDHTNMIIIPYGYGDLRAGARFPDLKPSKNEAIGSWSDNRYAGMGDNPWWHGNFGNNSGFENNYVSSYVYATRLANALGEGKSIYTAVVPNGYKTLCSNMLSDIFYLQRSIGWGLMEYLVIKMRHRKGNVPLYGEWHCTPLRIHLHIVRWFIRRMER